MKAGFGVRAVASVGTGVAVGPVIMGLEVYTAADVFFAIGSYEYMLILLAPPQTSVALPGQGKLQSDFDGARSFPL